MEDCHDDYEYGPSVKHKRQGTEPLKYATDCFGQIVKKHCSKMGVRNDMGYYLIHYTFFIPKWLKTFASTCCIHALLHWL